MRVEPSIVDFHHLRDAFVVDARAGRDGRRPAQRPQQHVTAPRGVVAGPDGQRADPLQFGERDVGGPGPLRPGAAKVAAALADPPRRAAVSRSVTAGQVVGARLPRPGGGRTVRAAGSPRCRATQARHRAGDGRVGVAEQPLPGGELARHVRRVTEAGQVDHPHRPVVRLAAGASQHPQAEVRAGVRCSCPAAGRSPPGALRTEQAQPGCPHRTAAHMSAATRQRRRRRAAAGARRSAAPRPARRLAERECRTPSGDRWSARSPAIPASRTEARTPRPPPAPGTARADRRAASPRRGSRRSRHSRSRSTASALSAHSQARLISCPASRTRSPKRSATASNAVPSPQAGSTTMGRKSDSFSRAHRSSRSSGSSYGPGSPSSAFRLARPRPHSACRRDGLPGKQRGHDPAEQLTGPQVADRSLRRRDPLRPSIGLPSRGQLISLPGRLEPPLNLGPVKRRAGGAAAHRLGEVRIPPSPVRHSGAPHSGQPRDSGCRDLFRLTAAHAATLLERPSARQDL